MSDLPSPQKNAHARTKVLRLEADYARLQSEVERLRKAGDDMAVVIAYELRIDEGEELPICVQAWNAAKEGKPTSNE